MRLIALRRFNDSCGTFDVGTQFVAKTGYAQHLIDHGMAVPASALLDGSLLLKLRPDQKLKRIRGGSGLGDSIYLRVIVEALLKQGELLEVYTDYPELFAGLSVVTKAFQRTRTEFFAHYTNRKQYKHSTQFQDMCVSAGIRKTLPLRIDWSPKNQRLLAQVRDAAQDRPIVLVHGGRSPMARTDGFGAELLPSRDAFLALLSELRERGKFLIGVGSGKKLYELPCDLDLHGKTSVSDLLDLGWKAEGALAQCSFMIPLMEALMKPLLVLWSRRGLDSSNAFVSSVTPGKVLERLGSSSAFVVDDAPETLLKGSCHALC